MIDIVLDRFFAGLLTGVTIGTLFYLFPVRVVSTSNNCAGNTIILTFLEEINIKYILIKNPNQSDNSNLIKSYTITAYS